MVLLSQLVDSDPMDNFLAIDIHIHIQPLEMMTPEALEAFGIHHAATGKIQCFGLRQHEADTRFP
jgi:hypothetical protein